MWGDYIWVVNRVKYLGDLYTEGGLLKGFYGVI